MLFKGAQKAELRKGKNVFQTNAQGECFANVFDVYEELREVKRR